MAQSSGGGDTTIVTAVRFVHRLGFGFDNAMCNCASYISHWVLCVTWLCLHLEFDRWSIEKSEVIWAFIGRRRKPLLRGTLNNATPRARKFFLLNREPPTIVTTGNFRAMNWNTFSVATKRLWERLSGHPSVRPSVAWSVNTACSFSVASLHLVDWSVRQQFVFQPGRSDATASCLWPGFMHHRFSLKYFV